MRDGHGFLIALTAASSTSLTTRSHVARRPRRGDGPELLAPRRRADQGVLPSRRRRGAVIGYLPTTGRPADVHAATADAATGALRVLLQRAADADLPTFYPGLSSDRFAVIGGGGSLGDLLGGSGAARH